MLKNLSGICYNEPKAIDLKEQIKRQREKNKKNFFPVSSSVPLCLCERLFEVMLFL